MFDKYILLHRKPKRIIKVYTILILILLFIFIFLIYEFEVTPYLIKKVEIKFLENNYYLKLNADIKDLNIISSKDKIIIDNNEYLYKIYKIENNRIDSNKMDIYLMIYELPIRYKIDNYQLIIKIKDNKKRIIKYLKEGEK